MNYRRTFHYFFVITISLSLLYLAFTKIDISVVIERLRQTKLEYVLLGICTFLISYLIRAKLWKELLRASVDVPIIPLFKAVVIGQMGNNIFPFRGGEILRIYSIKKTGLVNAPLALSSITLERVLDLISLIVLIGFLSIWIDLPDLLSRSIIIIVFCTIILFFIMIFLARVKPSKKYFNWLVNITPKNKKYLIDNTINNLIKGFASLQNSIMIFVIISLSLGCWILAYFSIVFSLKSYHIEAGWIMPLFVLVVLNIGMMLPLLPASLGAYQFFSILALEHFGIDRSIAIGYSFVIQSIDLIASVGFGLIFFYTGRLKFSKIFNKATTE